MSYATLQDGTEIAFEVHVTSDQEQPVPISVQTTGDLLKALSQSPPPAFSILKSTCALIGTYLDYPGDQIPLGLIEARRRGFRQFLTGRRYAKATVRTYVNQLGKLLKYARQFGWNPDSNVTEPWKALLSHSSSRRIKDIVTYFSRTTQSPAEVSDESVKEWGEVQFQEGLKTNTIMLKKSLFWRLLQQTGWITTLPLSRIKLTKYGTPFDKLAPALRKEIEALLKWKQVDFAPNRPKRGKIRAITAVNLKQVICQLAGYVTSVSGEEPTSMVGLIQKDNVEGFAAWLLNERGMKGHTLKPRLGMVGALLKTHPLFASEDYSWFRPLVDSIPLENESEREKRKAERYIDYEALEAIPSAIHAERLALLKKGYTKRAARLAMEELMLRWLSILPWRQRNIRECRIGGSSPNIFKAKIGPFSDLDKPVWVLEEEQKNPDAEFWQIRFTAKETKTGVEVHTLLPRRLIAPLEEYIADFRPHLLNGKATPTLFLTNRGNPLSAKCVQTIVGDWAYRCGGVRTNPHLIRDIFAFRWLKEHPRDFLVLAKILWHRNVQTTIQIYGARFNVSSGVCAVEAWLDQREEALLTK